MNIPEPVRVWARVRPPLPTGNLDTSGSGTQARITTPDKDTLSVETTPTQTKTYRLDGVWHTRGSSVVWRPLWKKWSKGYHCTVVSYGGPQAGTSTTATEIVEHMIRRTFQKDYFVKLSVNEIIDNGIYDILTPQKPQRQLIAGTGRIQSCKVIYVKNMRDLKPWLQLVQKVRENNRSHVLYCLTLHAVDRLQSLHRVSRLVIADLASQSSDASLTSWRNAVLKRKYTPCVLTRLLKPSLTGQSYLTLIANCSPDRRQLKATHATLMFGRQARHVITKARKTASAPMPDYDKMVHRLKALETQYQDLYDQLQSTTPREEKLVVEDVNLPIVEVDKPEPSTMNLVPVDTHECSADEVEYVSRVPSGNGDDSLVTALHTEHLVLMGTDALFAFESPGHSIYRKLKK